MSGQEVDFRGQFFELRGAIRPAPAIPIPILVGGRSEAALRRAGELGDGWLALWVSPRRFAEAIEIIKATAETVGRKDLPRQHGLQLWAGFGESPEQAQQRVRASMETAYSLPFDRFERYVPCGPPGAIAEALGPYLALGCRCFNFVPEGASLDAAIEAIAEVKALLIGASSPRI
jgi:alkanesulfonate monooxygenase SsuD/methylene tetrahydromethanopterin reductase-like flavin-dependent oxidoreductase (luciferase family)